MSSLASSLGLWPCELLVGWGAEPVALDAAAATVPLDRLEELFVP